RRCQLLIELLGVAAGMYQLPLPTVPGLRIQPTHLLPAGMEITPYNHHCEGSFLPSVFGPQIKTTGFRIEPSFLSNQSFAADIHLDLRKRQSGKGGIPQSLPIRGFALA